MIYHVSVCLLAHEEKGLISDTFRHTKWEYSFSVRPIGCTPTFYILERFPFKCWYTDCRRLLIGFQYFRIRISFYIFVTNSILIYIFCNRGK